MSRLLVYFLIILFLSNCHSKAAEESIDRSPGTSGSETASFMEKVKEYFSSTLSLSEYLTWLKAHRGLTFDEQENERFRLNILYKPLQLETAMSTDLNSKDKKSDYEKLLNVKKGFQYFTVEFLEKYRSASELNNSKKQFLDVIKSNTFFVKDNSDTISNALIEVFPSSLLNQPSQILILIPMENINHNLQAIVKGEPLGLKDLHLDISKEQFESFPKLKL